MPAIIGKNGMEGRMPIELNEDEIKALKESAETLRNVLEEIE
jgi:L-lactate dehydrogenase